MVPVKFEFEEPKSIVWRASIVFECVDKRPPSTGVTRGNE